MSWNRRWVIGWLILAVLGLGYEVASIVDGNTATPTLTSLITTHVSEEVTLTALIWLVIHFWIRYRRS